MFRELSTGQSKRRVIDYQFEWKWLPPVNNRRCRQGIKVTGNLPGDFTFGIKPQIRSWWEKVQQDLLQVARFFSTTAMKKFAIFVLSVISRLSRDNSILCNKKQVYEGRLRRIQGWGWCNIVNLWATSIYLSIYLRWFTGISLSVCLSVHPSWFISIYLSIYLSQFILSLYLDSKTVAPVYLSIYLSILKELVIKEMKKGTHNKKNYKG